MKSNDATLSSKIPSTTPLRVPRLNSLQHRLGQARDAGGRPIDLVDELLFLVDDPPAGITDRWQAGADLCAKHGIETSRMSVWRFYRANILPWRRGQNPPPAPNAKGTARLREQLRHLAAQRVLEMLQDPGLTIGHVIALLQTDNQARKLELAHEELIDRIDDRDQTRQREHRQRLENNARADAMLQRVISGPSAIPPHSGR